MTMIREDKPPGAGEQFYVEATTNPREFAKNVLDLDKREITFEKEMEIRQWRGGGRTWECGREYFDLETGALFTLEAVVRKSPWCSTQPAKECPPRLDFHSSRYGSLLYDPNRPDEDPTDRFRERYRPTHRGPL